LRLFLKTVFILALAGAVLSLVRTAPKGCETDLFALVGTGDSVVGLVAPAASRTGRVLFEGTNRTDLVRAADALLPPAWRTSCDPASFIAAYRGRTVGLLAPETRAALEAGRYDEVFESSLAVLFGPTPPLFPVNEDPMLLADGFVRALADRAPEGWSTESGYAVRSSGGREYLLAVVMPNDVSPDVLAAFTDAAEARRDVRVYCSGAPFHAARATRRSKNEINVLSVLSLVCVLVLGWRLLRSWRFAPALLVAIACGGVFAAAAVFALPARPHVLTFVFGTSLIGLSVDYVYHRLSAGSFAAVARPLTQSLVTTLVCFLPLFAAPVGVLREMALFACAGLGGAYLCVALLLPPGKERAS